MSYSVLSEPLIAVIPGLGAAPREVSLRDAIVHAHEYVDIAGDSSVEQFAVLRFLSAFVMDMLAMRTAKDRRKVFQSGRFDEKVFDEYVALCKSEGASFDLFDPKAPFMQSVFTPEEHKKVLKPAAVLDLYQPSGNNHTFYSWTPSVLGHAIENDVVLTPPKAFRCLCTRQTFCAYSLEGPKGITVMPLFLYTAGNTLFETIMMQTLSMEEAEAEGYTDYGLGSVPWRKNAMDVSVKGKAPAATFLQALTWQPRKVQMVCDLDGLVHKVCLTGGMEYCGEPWKDINTYGLVLVNKKTGEITTQTMKARYDQDSWLALLDMAYNSNTIYEPSVCVRNLPALFDGAIAGNVVLRMCGIQKTAQNYILVAVVEEETPLPECIHQNKEFIQGFGKDVRLLTQMAYDLKRSSKQLFQEKEDGKEPRSFQIVSAFTQKARELLMTLAVDDIFMGASPEEHAERFCERVKEIVNETIRFMRIFAGSSVNDMVSTREAEKWIRIALWKNIKTRKEEQS